MATVIWAAAAGVIIMDGAADAVIITAGTAVDITVTVIDTTSRRPCSDGLLYVQLHHRIQ
jgi:hypothetical protein